MKLLTPELWCISALFNGAVADDNQTRELDFDLARRSAILINEINGFINFVPDTLTGFDDLAGIVQEVDVDPDNVDVWQGLSVAVGGVLYDTSRVFRQRILIAADTATGMVVNGDTQLKMSWRDVPYVERPMSTTNIRHHVRLDSVIDSNFECEINIRYHIVELTLEELGLINASRR